MLSSCYVQLPSFYDKVSRSTQRRQLNFPGDAHLWYLYLPIMWFFINPFKALSKSLFGIVATRGLESHSAVPTFYAPTTVNDLHILIYFVLPVIAVLFGALHCIGWNFDFPTHIEQLLWRIGTLAITSIPSVPFLIGSIMIPLASLRNKRSKDGVQNMLRRMLAVVPFPLCAAIISYMFARLLLLTQAVVLLRKQPESAFYAINWANFLLVFDTIVVDKESPFYDSVLVNTSYNFSYTVDTMRCDPLTALAYRVGRK